MASITITTAIILGIIQGLTEWLPISSSGHLVMAQTYLGLEDLPIIFDILLHVGTLIVILIFFRMDILKMIKALYRTLRDIKAGQSVKQLIYDDPDRKLIWLIIIGSIPTAIIGFVFSDLFESFFSSLKAVSIALIITGIILWCTRYIKPRTKSLGDQPDKNKNINSMTEKTALLIGISQGFAIIPGISRSGSTISTGLYLDLNKTLAMKYSFLLAVPAIVGATIFKCRDLFNTDLTTQIPLYLIAIGMLVAMIVGYITLKILYMILDVGKFHYFAVYCWALGITLLLFH